MIPVRDTYATATAAVASCGFCGHELTGRADQQWCSKRCRQRAWRQLNTAPVVPKAVPRSEVVYACPDCDTYYLGVFRSL